MKLIPPVRLWQIAGCIGVVCPSLPGNLSGLAIFCLVEVNYCMHADCAKIKTFMIAKIFKIIFIFFYAFAGSVVECSPRDR